MLFQLTLETLDASYQVIIEFRSTHEL